LTTFKLLSHPQDNPKVAKNYNRGVLTAPLHLAPYNLSGYQVCPMASKGCAAACLHTAGNPAFMEAKNKGRIRKTKLFFEDRETFMRDLVKDIEKLDADAVRVYFSTGVRLNATSDVPWETIKVTHEGITYDNIMKMFPQVIFYDYTKRHNRKNLPQNYHLTFSLSEDNEDKAEQMLLKGMNVAVVFSGKEFPKEYTLGNTKVPVVSGDEHDFRPADPRGTPGYIIALKAKGKARKDTSGFVRHTA
jgi:hypothetical protein